MSAYSQIEMSALAHFRHAETPLIMGLSHGQNGVITMSMNEIDRLKII